MLQRYRATGADLPFADLRRAHGVAMEGYFWRLSDPASGRVIVALCGIHRGRAGRPWANVAIAAHPGDFIAAADLAGGTADPAGLGVLVGDGAFEAGPTRVRADLGARGALDLTLHDVHAWPRRVLGGMGTGQVVPGLSQHWHPHVLGARASGTVRLGDETIDLDGFNVYAEKNWGRDGFPDRWWWGHAQHFEDAPDTCVAFAGGAVTVGPLQTTATALVVRRGDTLIRLGDPVMSPVRAEVGDGSWRLKARGPRWGIELTATADPQDAHVLPVPLPARGYSVAGALQQFAGELHLVLRRRGRIVYAGRSPLAGLEDGGRDAVEREIARRKVAA